MYPLVNKNIIVMYLDWTNRFFKIISFKHKPLVCVRFILKRILIRSNKKGQIDNKILLSWPELLEKKHKKYVHTVQYVICVM
jgi:hypothetical protein